MKKSIIIWISIFCLLLSGCGAALPEKAADGTAWSEDWITLGNIMGVENIEGLTVERNEDVLAAEGMYYVVWTGGSSINYTNAEGNEVSAHELEIHLVAEENKSSDAAAAHAEAWKQLTDERYPDSEKREAQYAGQSFEVCTYSVSVPAAQGASATGLRGINAIRVDVIALDSYSGDAAQILADFLSHCHYAA